MARKMNDASRMRRALAALGAVVLALALSACVRGRSTEDLGQNATSPRTDEHASYDERTFNPSTTARSLGARRPGERSGNLSTTAAENGVVAPSPGGTSRGSDAPAGPPGVTSRH